MATAIEQIQAAAANWSIEVTPTGATKIESFRDCLNEGTTVNVTFLPGTDPADTIAVCERLHNDGMKPVPHLAARSLCNADQLDELLATADVFVIATPLSQATEGVIDAAALDKD